MQLHLIKRSHIFTSSNYQLKNNTGLNMSSITQDSELHQQMTSWRHWLHQHPELSFNELLTSDYIASVLEGHNIEHH